MTELQKAAFLYAQALVECYSLQSHVEKSKQEHGSALREDELALQRSRVEVAELLYKLDQQALEAAQSE